MPIYLRQCSDCGHEWDELRSLKDYKLTNPCPECGCIHINRPIVSAHYIPFKEGWFEHITTEPLYIKNKQELRDACRKHGKTSVYLEDM